MHWAEKPDRQVESDLPNSCSEFGRSPEKWDAADALLPSGENGCKANLLFPSPAAGPLGVGTAHLDLLSSYCGRQERGPTAPLQVLRCNKSAEASATGATGTFHQKRWENGALGTPLQNAGLTSNPREQKGAFFPGDPCICLSGPCLYTHAASPAHSCTIPAHQICPQIQVRPGSSEPQPV